MIFLCYLWKICAIHPIYHALYMNVVHMIPSLVHHMHTIHDNARHNSHDALHNMSLHYAIHNNKPIMMDDMFLYHASHLFEHWMFPSNQIMHVCIIMDDVYIYHAHTFFPL